jgi:hypothetical protein
MDLLILALTALVPLVIGSIWFSPKVFGNAWKRAADISEEKKTGNMAVIFLLTYLLSFMLAAILQALVIHQSHIMSIVLNEPGFGDPKSEVGMVVDSFMAKYGNNFRTFKHGALHGTIAGIFLALPILGINAMFERKKFKYVMINAGFWTICLAIMGGILCQFIKIG